MNKRDDAHLMSGAYALDAVTPEEAALVEAAMAESEELHSEVVGLADTAVTLGLSLPPVAPPARLRASLLDAIESLPQEQPAVERAGFSLAELAGEPADASVPDDSTAPDEFAPVIVSAMPAGQHQVPVRRRRRRRSPMVLLATAVAAVVIFSGGFFVQRTLFETQSEYTRISTAADVQHSTAGVAGGGIATVYWSKSEHRTAVVLNDVAAPSGRVLQLWSVRGDTVTSAGLYEPQGGEHYMLLSGTPNSGETLAVSIEPEGGSTQPTTKPIVAVPLRA